MRDFAGTPPRRLTGMYRTGPVSRAVRLIIVAALGSVVWDLSSDGLAGFSDPDTLGSPGFWVMTGLVMWGASAMIGRTRAAWARRWGRVAFAGLLLTLTLVSLAIYGTVWQAPLTWAVFALDIGVLTWVGLLSALAVVTGTPGCESGALREVVARARGHWDPDHAEVDACPGGLHRLDDWESRQPWRRSATRNS